MSTCKDCGKEFSPEEEPHLLREDETSKQLCESCLVFDLAGAERDWQGDYETQPGEGCWWADVLARH